MRRRAGKALLLLLAVALAVVVLNGLRFRQRHNPRPLPPDIKKGAFHLHSHFSDGRGSPQEICRDARAQGLDFVVLTDHGRPNRESSLATAWIDDTLLVGASEFSLHAGHMAAAGYRLPGYVFPPEAQEAIDEVRRDSGVTFLSHPFDRKIPWTDWQASGFTGIEILSLYQMAKRNLLYGLTLFPLQYLLNPDAALTSIISYPGRELAAWDRSNRSGRHFGIYALDSHAKIPISRSASLHFPSYGATFRILTVYARVERDLDRDAGAAAATVVAALRQGRFYNAIESLAPANGFDFFALEADGRRVEMGGDADVGCRLVVKLPFLFATRVLLLRDGEPFRSFVGNRRQLLEIPVERPGVYRCQVAMDSGRFSRLPWILANPIFVSRPAPAPAAAAEVRALRTLSAGAAYFQVEKNERSRGELAAAAGEGGRPLSRLAFQLRRQAPDIVDFWVSLARRERLDLSAYRGLVFQARGSRPMRFWLQFRVDAGGGESAFQHSFRVDEQWRQVAIPFERCHRLYGSGAPADRGQASAIFILIDNGNSHDGAAGELELGPIELF